MIIVTIPREMVQYSIFHGLLNQWLESYAPFVDFSSVLEWMVSSWNHFPHKWWIIHHQSSIYISEWTFGLEIFTSFPGYDYGCKSTFTESCNHLIHGYCYDSPRDGSVFYNPSDMINKELVTETENWLSLCFGNDFILISSYIEIFRLNRFILIVGNRPEFWSTYFRD